VEELGVVQVVVLRLLLDEGLEVEADVFVGVLEEL
jgi:hypothetical protein